MEEEQQQNAIIVEGALGSCKSECLLEQAVQLLSNEPSSSVLILCSNHMRQKQFKEALLKRLDMPIAELPVYTFNGLVRTKLFDYWPLVEAQIKPVLGDTNARIRPELSGMVDSEWILSLLAEGLTSKNPAAFQDFPGSDRSMVRQLLRRLRLRSENTLTREQMSERSSLLNEPCQNEVSILEQWFDRTSYATRFLDASKQLDVFKQLLEKDSLLAKALKSQIKHLVVDDVDETPAIQQWFVAWLIPSLKSLTLAADPKGGSRRGYLNAYPYGWPLLKKQVSDSFSEVKTELLNREDEVFQTANMLLKNWKKTSGYAPVNPVITLDDEAITRTEMMDRVVKDILVKLADGYTAGDLAVVLPKMDLLSLYQLHNRLKRRAVNIQVLSGTQRAMDNPWSQCVVYLLQILNSTRWQIYPSRWELRHLIINVLKLGYLEPEHIGQFCDFLTDLKHRNNDDILPEPTELAALKNEGESVELLPEEFTVGEENHQHLWVTDDVLSAYELFYNAMQLFKDLVFDEQIFTVFDHLIRPQLTENTVLDPVREIIESYQRQRALFVALSNNDSEFLEMTDAFDFDRFWLQQVKHGSVADTPDSPPEIDNAAIVVGTPQKLIDFEISRKIQYWLDVSSREWARSDNAPLYNGWVHSAVWDGNEAALTEDFQEKVIRARAGHINRSLVLLCGEKILAFTSDLDDYGFTQDGMLKERLFQSQSDGGQTDVSQIQLATLRDDQQQVLTYNAGTMAISAVPGAGKTFVNVELILSLIKQGVPPSSILVLTYMDSAAKTLLGRLKKKLAGITRDLPVVSTIHSLAFKMLTENDHALRLGFSIDDLKVMDDFEKNDLMMAAANRTLPESVKNQNDWQRAVDRGISHAKTHRITPVQIEVFANQNPQHFRLKEFLPAYKLYLNLQKQQGVIDFTDLIVKATELLEKFPDIRQKYQERFQIVIEDEAQDSSTMLQHFIGLLGGEKPNLIRTGDTNQSITTTFSSADTTVFRNFIQSADLVVEMDHSGRCAPEINELANFFMTAAGNQTVLKEAFQPMMMKVVTGQNPTLIAPVVSVDFTDAEREETWMIEAIHQLREQNEDLSIAILVRQNNQAYHFTDRLQRAGVPAISLGDQLTVTPVFYVILNFLMLLENPGKIEAQVDLYDAMMKAHILGYDENRLTFLKSEPLFYIKPDAVSTHEYLAGDPQLLQLYYDWQELYQLSQSGSLFKLMIQLAERLFYTVEDRSNGYLCALLTDEVLSFQDDLLGLSPLEWVIQHFQELQKSKRSRRGFGDLISRRPEEFVQVMSLHKSKGQEFDVVFMPQLQNDLFPTDPAKIRFDEGDKLQLSLSAINSNEKVSTDPQAAKQKTRLEKIEEEARLIYVGITRAKKALLTSCHAQAMNRYGKMQAKQPALAYQMIEHWVNTIQPELIVGQQFELNLSPSNFSDSSEQPVDSRQIEEVTG